VAYRLQQHQIEPSKHRQLHKLWEQNVQMKEALESQLQATRLRGKDSLDWTLHAINCLPFLGALSQAEYFADVALSAERIDYGNAVEEDYVLVARYMNMKNNRDQNTDGRLLTCLQMDVCANTD